MNAQEHIDLINHFSAHNYHPYPVVLAEGEGVWVKDVEGKRYLDMLAAYSAVNFGHRHPALIAAAKAQLDKITLTSRAFHNDQLGPFCRDLAQLCGMETVLPMNTGAEGVETAIKLARKWGYEKKGVPGNEAVILVCDGNFHGRTITIVSFSTDDQARGGFGPYTPGFKVIPYGDADALEAAITDRVVGFLFEPVQGEAGVVFPQDGYIKKVREICTRKNVLMIADEIQSGLGRTGKTFACDHENVKPDVYILGKALGGGIMPISAVVSSHDIFSVIRPGDHGSTFGGNPLATAIAREVIRLLRTGEFQTNATKLGKVLFDELTAARLPAVKEIRSRGLWAGIVVDTKFGNGRHFGEKLMANGLLCKETHENTIRLAPPLCISESDLGFALERLKKVLNPN